MASSVDTVIASSSSTFRVDEIVFEVLSRVNNVPLIVTVIADILIRNQRRNVDPSDVGNQIGALADAFVNPEERLALSKTASIPGSVLNYSDPDWQSINEFIGSPCNLCNQMPEDGSTNWDLPPRFDVTPDDSDDADEMVQDYVADLPLIGLENESLSNLSNGEVQLITNFIESLSNLSIQMLEDGSYNLDLPPRFDDSQDEADNDVDEMVQDYVADLPLELPPRYDDYIDDAVDVMQEAHVVPDDVADAPQACPICVTNARNMAFLCGHTTCVECGERLDTCHICREPISRRIRLFLG